MQAQNPPPDVRSTDLAFFLDLDGTLAPIVDDPDKAAVPPETLAVLSRLVETTQGAVAIVSGRALDEVDRMLHPMVLNVAGSHGAEMRGGGTAATAGRIPTETVRRVQAFGKQHSLLVEPKAGAVALHYRSAPDLGPECRALIDEVAQSDPALRAMHGKMVSEVALKSHSKGTAIEVFLATQAFMNRLPVMVGDDVTDEDGFTMAQQHGGFGIKVGEGDTVARYQVSSLEDLRSWLAATLS